MESKNHPEAWTAYTHIYLCAVTNAVSQKAKAIPAQVKLVRSRNFLNQSIIRTTLKVFSLHKSIKPTNSRAHGLQNTKMNDSTVEPIDTFLPAAFSMFSSEPLPSNLFELFEQEVSEETESGYIGFPMIKIPTLESPTYIGCLPMRARRQTEATDVYLQLPNLKEDCSVLRSSAGKTFLDPDEDLSLAFMESSHSTDANLLHTYELYQEDSSARMLAKQFNCGEKAINMRPTHQLKPNSSQLKWLAVKMSTFGRVLHIRHTL